MAVFYFCETCHPEILTDLGFTMPVKDGTI
jgi:hypothetical protein